MKFQDLTAYELLQEQELNDIHATGYLFRHKKSGARISAVLNDDENKVFYIAFRTPPKDSTGVTHIIEHTVLCGSEQFPAKDPFVELVKGSLNTFLNAITYPDKTVYPVASCNEKDFQNLMHVYLDAVFHPNIYKKEEIFRQEGWHYELEEKDAPLTINGVVYNEMKGAFSSPEGVLDRMILNSLFPDTAYQHESGGDPEVIPELTYEDYLNFHSKYYHPSNSYIYLYGNLDIEEKLRFLDAEYLSQYEAIAVDSAIQKQQPFEKPVEVTKTYSLSSSESETDNTYLAYNAVVGETLNRRLCMAFDVLEYALLTAPGAPLKKALIDAGIGKDIMGGYDDSTLQPIFSVVAKNANQQDKERFLTVIRETLEAQVKDGLNTKALLAGINSSEFRFREADFGSYPKGLIYGLDCMESWLYDDTQPFSNLEALAEFQFLKEQVSTGYFEQLIRTYLLENTHVSVISVLPEKGLNAKTEEALAKKLETYKNSLTEAQILKLIEDTSHLKEYQDEPSPKEDLEKIPMLTRADLKKEAAPFCNAEERLDGTLFLKHEMFTGGITYLNLMFDLSEIPEEDVPYLGLLKAILGYVDTAHYSYADLANEINLMTGGISSYIGVYADLQKQGAFTAKYEVRARLLEEKTKETFALLREILTTSSLADEKRLYEIIAQVKSRLQMSLSSAGHSVSALRAMSYFSESAKYNDMTGGIALYRVIADLEKNFEEKKGQFIAKIRELMVKVFRSENLMFSITADESGIALVKQSVSDFLGCLFTETAEKTACVIHCEKQNEGLKDASQVQYVSRAGNFISKGFSYTGTLRILKVILSYDYLWLNIRVKGGAYGCMSGFSRIGDSYFSSYRDPNLRGTNEIYEKTPEYLKQFAVDERDMTKYIIGTVSDLDTPLNPSARGLRSTSAYLSGLTYEMVQQERDEIIGAKVEDIQALSAIVEAVLSQDCLCVIGSEDALEAESDMFENLVDLY